MSLTNFGMKQGSFHPMIERESLWTCRVATAARRTVVIFNVSDITVIMKKQGMVSKDVRNFAKDMGQASCQELVNMSARVFSATLQKGDALWVPASVIVLEQVGDEADHFGLRFQMLLARDTARYKTVITDVAAAKITPSTHMSKEAVKAFASQSAP